MQSVFHGDLGGNGLSEFEKAGALGVASLAALEGLNGGGGDVRGSVQVRLTGAEAQPVDSPPLERLRRGRDPVGL